MFTTGSIERGGKAMAEKKHNLLLFWLVIFISILMIFQVTETLAQSPTETLVTEYYTNILDRSPDAGGRDAWVAEIERIEHS